MFKNLKIQSKLMLVTFISGFTMIAMAMYAISEVGRVQNLEAKYDLQREMVHLSELAEKTLIQMADLQNRYASSANTYYVDQHNILYEKLRGELNTLSLKDREEDFSNTVYDISLLRYRFEQLSEIRKELGLNETSGYHGALAGAANVLENKLENLIHFNGDLEIDLVKDVQHHVLMMRLDENKLIHENYSKGIVSLVEASLFDVQTHLAGLSLNEKQRQGFDLALGDYEKALEAFIATKLVLQEKQLAYVKLKNGILKAIRIQTHSYKRGVEPIMNATKVARIDMQYNLIIAMVSSLLIVVFVGTVVTNDISNHYQFIGSYLKKLAKRDYLFKVNFHDSGKELDGISKDLERIQKYLVELEEPVPQDEPSRKSAFDGTNVIDLRQKMFERNQFGASPLSKGP